MLADLGLSQRPVFKSRHFELVRGPTNTEREPPTVCSFFFCRFAFRRLVFLLRPRIFAQIPVYVPVFFERICGS